MVNVLHKSLSGQAKGLKELILRRSISELEHVGNNVLIGSNAFHPLTFNMQGRDTCVGLKRRVHNATVRSVLNQGYKIGTL